MTDIHKIFKDNSIACDDRVVVTVDEWNDIAKYIESLHLKIDTLTDDCKLTALLKRTLGYQLSDTLKREIVELIGDDE